MHILLIAYEFPPSPSPQSLRWTYLCKHLADLGCRITVLTIDLGGSSDGLPSLPHSVSIKRTFAGPVRGTVATLRKRRQSKVAPSNAADGRSTPSTAVSSRHGWKHRVASSILELAGKAIFPDVRGEWLLWAKPALIRILEEDRPDVVFSSHEPATSLQLGLLAKDAGIPWIADLGDPVLAPYTPKKWVKRSHELERIVCERADFVTVTTPAAEKLLAERHNRHRNVEVVPQGFEIDPRSEALFEDSPGDTLNLLYTGSFYSFRRPDALLAAVARNSNVTLSIAAVSLPDSVLLAAQAMPEKIILLGFLTHQQAIAAQRRADILINIGNQDPSQVPGKLYEYLGAQRPILHLGKSSDAISHFVRQLNRGWSCENEPDQIEALLSKLVEEKAQGKLDENLRLDIDSVRMWSWQQAATHIQKIAEQARQHAADLTRRTSGQPT